MLQIQAVLLALILGLAPLSAWEQTAPAEPVSVTVDRLIDLLENPELHEQLIDHLRGVASFKGSGEPADAPEVLSRGLDEDGSPPQLGTGLIGALGEWSNRLSTSLPSTTFGIPIELKVQQAWTQTASLVRAGMENGRLPDYVAWALPGLLLVAIGGYALRKVADRLTIAERTVRKRRLVAGLVLKTFAHAALFFAAGTVVSLPGPLLVEGRVFLTSCAGVILSLLMAELTASGLSGLAGMRGRRLVRYCKRKFYPWLLTIVALAVGAGVLHDPEIRDVTGRSSADLAVFVLNLGAAITTIVFVFRHRPAIGRLLFGATSRWETSLNPIVNATRRIARHWHLFAYAFLGLSIASLFAGQRENDVLVQILWSFGTVLGALVLASLLRRVFAVRSRRFGRGAVRRALSTAIYDTFRWCSDIVIGFGTILMLARVWGFDLLSWLLNEGQPLTRSLFAVGVCVALAWFVWVVVDAWIESALTPTGPTGGVRASSNRARTLLPLVRNGVVILLSVLTCIVALANVGVDVTPLIAGAGVFGLALSFGSQQLVQDVMTGLFILVEDTIAIGDTVNTGDRSGIVESISLRTIRLRDADGALHSVPFSTIKAFKNSSRNYGVFRPSYAVPSNVDPEAVMQVMQETAAQLLKDGKHASISEGVFRDLGIEEIRSGAVVVGGYILTLPARQTELARIFNRRFIETLANRGIAL